MTCCWSSVTNVLVPWMQSWLGAQVQARKFNQSCPTKRQMKTGNFDEKQYCLCALIDFFLQLEWNLLSSFLFLFVEILFARMFVLCDDNFDNMKWWHETLFASLNTHTSQVASHSIFSKWHSTVVGNGQYKENQWTCYLFFIYAKGNWLELINECDF